MNLWKVLWIATRASNRRCRSQKWQKKWSRRSRNQKVCWLTIKAYLRIWMLESHWSGIKFWKLLTWCCNCIGLIFPGKILLARYIHFRDAKSVFIINDTGSKTCWLRRLIGSWAKNWISLTSLKESIIRKSPLKVSSLASNSFSSTSRETWLSRQLRSMILQTKISTNFSTGTLILKTLWIDFLSWLSPMHYCKNWLAKITRLRR